MRGLIVLSCLLFFLNCEDKQKKKAAKPEVLKSNKKNISKSLPPQSLKLDTKSAMSFFLEYEKNHKENKVRITTDFGTIDILLYKETKFHRANFIWLTKQKYFNGTQFYRVINNFMIQAGNGDDEETTAKRRQIGKYLLPPDTKRGFKHHRGVISMPSSDINNPYKLASPYEFFIVQQKGGAHHLNGDYTIFGHVIQGIDVIDKIATVKTDTDNWPIKNVYIRRVDIIE